MEQKIIKSETAEGLNQKIVDLVSEGWYTIGSHQVVEKSHQLQYAGMQHKRTLITSEYSQTMAKIELARLPD